MSAGTLAATVAGDAQALADCLQQEQQALTRGDGEAVARITASKNRLVQALEQFSRSGGYAGLAPAEKQALLEQLALCRQRNLANAALLDARRTQTQWLLNTLGLSSERSYGVNGSSIQRIHSRSVGLA